MSQTGRGFGAPVSYFGTIFPVFAIRGERDREEFSLRIC
jgi:hypothetical protein